MTYIKILFLFVLISLGSSTAQTFIPQIISKNINSAINKKAVTSLNILAVLVEFQKDKYNLTTGDGKFGSLYTKDYGNNIIDPLPHNVNYFKDHLKFVKNYFSKVSNENLTVDYTVLPNTITVSKVMRDYSPVDNDGVKALGDLSKEVWLKNLSANPNVDYSSYDIFIIFHAGAGKDISTSELLGESRDLPSLYLGINSLKNFFGESFEGFDVGGGQVIRNSIILPETESRETEGIGGSVLIELSINGLLVSSIASHLGLPDLFDAETGKSAIGRFGLMDGQSLFAYKGLFPPQPSAWEKIFLGWDEPLVINSNAENIEILASEIGTDTDTRIIKVPINSSEYYLIENRARDAKNDGIKITYKIAGQIKTLSLPKDTTKFNNINADTLNGVVLNVDEFDWAVPGSGILIWHIDENVIGQNLVENRINTDKNRRGVDLEEADGIQDIGEEFKTIFGDIIIAEGDKHDLWFANNDSEFYTNKFNSTTKPNTNSNEGAKSLISFSNFSNISNRMTFDVSFGSESIRLIKTKSFISETDAEKIKLLSSNTNKGYFLSGSDLYLIDSTFLIKPISENFSKNDFTLVQKGNSSFVFGAFENQFNIIDIESETINTQSISLESNISSPISVQHISDNEIFIFVGLSNGVVKKYNYKLQAKEKPNSEETLSLLTNAIEQIAILDNEIAAFGGNQLYFKYRTNYSQKITQIGLTKSIKDKIDVIFLSEDNSLTKFIKGPVISFPFYSSEFTIKSFSIADIKQNGENYIVFYTGNELNAININGSMAENFPIKNNDINKFVATPLAADINNDGYSDILCTSDEGVIFAYSGIDGKLLNNFPIATGNRFLGNQTIIKRENDLLLSSVTDKNEFYFWSIKSNGKVDWGSKFGNNQNNSFLGVASGSQSVSEFFPKNRTYNWPNPVYENFTNIRTYVSEDSKIIIRIFDLSGDLVDILEYNATGGLDNEITWNVSDIQSGAYFAHVEVNSSNGKKDSKIIKIAVVK